MGTSLIEETLNAVDLTDAVVDDQTGTEEVVAPATPEPASPPAPAPAAEPGDGSVAEAGDTIIGGVRVDKLGRMHRADGTIMQRAEADAERARQAAAAPAADVVPAPSNKPFAFDSYGAAAPEFTGALESPSGDLFFPAAQAAQVRNVLARGMRYDGLRAEIAQTKQQLAATHQRNDAEGREFASTILQHFTSPEALQQLVDHVTAVGPQVAHLELGNMVERAQLKIEREFGRGAPAPAATDTAAPPLDHMEAAQEFDSYVREQLARPELQGMSAPMQQQVRRLLADAPLFERQGADWYLNEDRARNIWATAQLTLERERAITAASRQNAGPSQTLRPPNTTAVRPVPPSVNAPARVGTTTPPRAPAVREYDNPFDAIRYAPTAE